MKNINLNEKANHLFSKDFKDLTRKEQYYVTAAIANNMIAENIKETKTKTELNKQKEVYYFSMEFLMGRMLINNLMNLGLTDSFNHALKEYDLSINDIEFEELDAGLGNGGLGRLAACFMDSIAYLDLPGHGVTIRYRNGFFKQKFDQGRQIELPDLWLKQGNAWENKILDEAVDVSYYGTLTKENDQYVLNDALTVTAMPYDMPLVGKNYTNTLRMYDIQPVEDQANYIEYEKEILDITSCLYPDDSTDKGRELRVKQQYFFVSAGVQNIINKHFKVHQTLDNLPDYVVIQINDTHPTLVIPEMIRIMMDHYDYSYQDAFNLVNKTVAYTNHTLLSEALEKWDISLIKNLLPRIYVIIEQINAEFIELLKSKNYTESQIDKMKILSDTQVHMANLAIVGSFSVNGVAALHTKILVEREMKEWDLLYPNKFNNKTNGITHRRWFEYINPQLYNLVKSTANNISINDTIEFFETFNKMTNDDKTIKAVQEIKYENKLNLVQYIQKQEGITLNPNSIFDIQIKRLHAYKRQLLNALHIIYLYQRLKDDVEFRNNFHPQTFIFGAKAAPSYVFAKNVIKLINSLAKIINADEQTKDLLQVVMLTNYNVSYAEKLIPAADVSEQISTAGFEASGTGNMKFMMNGALTIGTMDGANVEIFDLVKEDNIFIFGISKDEVFELQKNRPCALEFVSKNQNLKHVFEFIKNLHLLDPETTKDEFEPIINDIFNENDYFLVLKDFDAYVEAQANVNELYKQQDLWTQKVIVNIAKSGFFSSDRTITDYVNDIWKIEKIK